MTPKVWNVYDPQHPLTAKYCGRGSPRGNPFKIPADGTRYEVCERFEREVLPTLNVTELRGYDLLRFCKPKRCHCDAILIKANK